MCLKMRWVLLIKDGAFFHNHLGSHKVTMGVMYGGRGTLLNRIRLCRTDITPCVALDMYGSWHLTIFYLLKGELGN